MSLKRKAGDLGTSDAKKPKGDGSITSFFGPPKTVAKTVSTTTKVSSKGTEKLAETTTEVDVEVKKWDKEAWAKKLTTEQRDLLGLEIQTLHESWLRELKDEITSKEFLDLKRFLKKEHESGKKVFPPAEDVYSWFVLPCIHPSQYFCYQLPFHCL
jgi:uracil-DNA glycosylase